MIEPRLIPFKAEHLLNFVQRDGETIDFRSAIIKEQSPSYTAMVDDLVIGCAGVCLQWSGVGIAWTMFSKDAERYMLWCTRTIRAVLRDITRAHNLHRIELTVLEGLPRYEAWARMLGFEREENGRARLYSQHKQNVIRYEFVK